MRACRSQLLRSLDLDGKVNQFAARHVRAQQRELLCLLISDVVGQGHRELAQRLTGLGEDAPRGGQVEALRGSAVMRGLDLRVDQLSEAVRTALRQNVVGTGPVGRVSSP